MDNNYKMENSEKIAVEGNKMRFANKVLQVSNISSIGLTEGPKIKYPVLILLLMVAFSVWLCMLKPVLGFILLIVDGTIPAYIWNHNNSLEHCLGISMNSGEVYLFSCYNEEFLSNVVKALQKSFDGGARMEVNFKNCTVDKPIFIENIMVNQWEQIENVWENALKECEEGTKAYDLLTESKDLIKRRDESGFIGFLKRNKDAIVSGVLSGALFEALKVLLPMIFL